MRLDRFSLFHSGLATTLRGIQPAAAIRPVAVLIAIVALSTALNACGKKQPPPPAPPQVTVAHPIVRDVVNYAEFTGTVRAVSSVEIRARVSGRLESVEFTPGSLVKKGQLLFVIEREGYKAARDHAAAVLQSAQAELASARSDEERISKAIENNAVSKQDLDQAIARRKMAEAAVLSAKAELAAKELDYSYTLVRSPIDGRVGRNLVDPGNLVGSSERTLLTTVNQIQPIYVYFDAPERMVLDFLSETTRRGVPQGAANAKNAKAEKAQAENAKAEKAKENAVDPADSAQTASPPDEGDDNQIGHTLVRLANEKTFMHKGYIDYVDNTVDPATGTIELRALLANEQQSLFPGLFVRIRVLGGTKKDAVLVDERSVGTDLGGKYVYVLDEQNNVEQRYITLGAKQEDGNIVVEEGLDGQETYIVNGMLRARPGFPVTPMTEEQMKAQAAQQKQAAATIAPSRRRGGGTRALEGATS